MEFLPNEMISATNSIPIGARVNAGNPSIPPVGPTPPPVTAFPVKGAVLSTLLGNLTPLAFISAGNENDTAATANPAKTKPGIATAAQLYNANSDIFLYAVASLSKSSTQAVQPDTLYLFYDDTARPDANWKQGSIIAEFSLPLVVLTGYPTAPAESLVPAKLQFRATNAGDCSASTVSGSFNGSLTSQTLMATQIGLDCAVVFAPSPLSPKSHAIFQVQVPLIVTNATDPLYFGNPISNLDPGFNFNADETGFIPASVSPPKTPILGANGNSIGIGPAAVPLGSPPATGVTSTFALCANLLAKNGSRGALAPSAAAYYAISTGGETLLSAALPGSSTSVCPF